MRELIEKLRAADSKTPTHPLSEEALVALGAHQYLGHWRFGHRFFADRSMDLLRSIDNLNEAFNLMLPGCGRITAKGRVSKGEPLYGCQIFATDLAPSPLFPIGEGEHELESYAYLIAMLEAVQTKRATRPENCRNRLKSEGKAYPKSGCDSCGDGGIFGCPYEGVSA